GAAGDADATATALARATARAERQTAVAAARATPEATPEPTLEPQPAGLVPEPGTLTLQDYQASVGALQQRLFETFDRGERTKAIWTQFENDSVAARLRDNFYALTLKGENKNMWETWDRDLGEHYNVELAVAFQEPGQPTTVGIAFDVQAEGDNGVFFEIFNDKHWQLRTVQDGRLVRAHSTGRIPVPEAQDGVGTNILWVVRTPQGTQLWINSVHVATVPPGPFAGGRAGVIASSRPGLNGEATVIADNFRVRTP
ncbi:MAG TPA: protein kinase, partial [Roseiflexaceae bacterium]|nr:protein kinase [Roseiflexaceae bacterium]